ncbi:MAG: hypothetical protein IGBAC_0666 [Ignavibacteriae bacterium]|nr:MAG: hypothetical protein IGBAC_0666 [Ignavibacteriota bacterium]
MENLITNYEKYFVHDLQSRRFQPETFNQIVQNIFKNNEHIFEIKEIGKSFEGRKINLIKIGEGKTKILLWSQMHGDESTATMAIADIFNFFAKFFKENEVQKLLSKISLFFIPILNPDGAAKHQRLSAQLIDLNRDALKLVTPEARILKQVQTELKPEIGFNLHDQELSTVGYTNQITRIALLAPALDENQSDNEVRIQAKKIAASLVNILNNFIPGKISRYDESYEPRAFGDKMQSWGTSTILIESGHEINDPEKSIIRKLNAVSLLSIFHDIANQNYKNVDISVYEKLPYNTYRAYDLIIRNVKIRYKNGTEIDADLGISYQVNTHTTDIPVLMEIGDLSTFVALKDVEGNGREISEEDIHIEKEFNLKKYFLEV